MIPTSTFNILVAAGFLMLLYAVIDHRNRVYANIIAVFIAAMIFAYTGTAAAIGAVAAGASPSLGDLLRFISLVCFGYTALMVYEVIDEKLTQQAELTHQEELE